MNGLDFAILGVLAWFTLASLSTGIIREVLHLGGIILGVWVAGRYYPQLAASLAFLELGQAENIVAFLLLLVAVAVGAHVVGFALQQVVSLLFLGWLDHLGGALFGFAKGFALVAVLLVLMARFPILGLDNLVRESRLAPLFLELVPVLLAFLPAEFQDIRSLVR